MVESGRIPGNGRIGASPEKLSLGVPENGRIRASIEKWLNPGDYPEMVESVRVLKNCPCEYRKMVEYVRV